MSSRSPTPRSTAAWPSTRSATTRRRSAARRRRAARVAARRGRGSRSGCARSWRPAASRRSPTRSRTSHGLAQLPGIAVQRLMADGYGFGAEGDWKTAALVRVDEGDEQRAWRAAPRSWRTTPTISARPGRRCSARTCSRSARRSRPKPRLRDPPAVDRREGRSGSARLHGRARSAVVAALLDLGDRFRLVANEVDVVKPDEAAAAAAGRARGLGAATRPGDRRRGVDRCRRRAPHAFCPRDRRRGAHRPRRDRGHRAARDRRDDPDPRLRQRAPLEPGVLPDRRGA